MSDDFKIKFRGVRGSYPVCKKNFLEYGGNTACVEVRCGGRLIILDCGTGIINLGIDEIKNSIVDCATTPHNSVILLSHIHQDHIQGLQFFKPIYVPQSKIELFGYSATGENIKMALKNLLFNKTFPVRLDEIKSDFKIHNFSPDKVLVLGENGQNKLFDIDNKNINIKEDDIKITSYKTTAHPKNGCLCFKIEYGGKSLVYATDKESYIGADKRFAQFARGCTCLIHDAQYTYQDYTSAVQPRQGFGHSTYEMAIEAATVAKAGKLFFFHYDPEYDDLKIKMLEHEFSKNNAGVFFAKENYEITL